MVTEKNPEVKRCQDSATETQRNAFYDESGCSVVPFSVEINVRSP
jgi:hypothetical protein